MTVVLLVCGIASLVAALLAGAFLPTAPAVAREEPAQTPVMVAPWTDTGE
jgi:hypothetical protein